MTHFQWRATKKSTCSTCAAATWMPITATNQTVLTRMIRKWTMTVTWQSIWTSFYLNLYLPPLLYDAVHLLPVHSTDESARFSLKSYFIHFCACSVALCSIFVLCNCTKNFLYYSFLILSGCNAKWFCCDGNAKRTSICLSSLFTYISPRNNLLLKKIFCTIA